MEDAQPAPRQGPVLLGEETAGRSGPIYSARMRCSSLAAPKQTTESNRIIVPNESGQLSVGPEPKELKTYHRCPSE
jgi:hypothetical protein